MKVRLLVDARGALRRALLDRLVTISDGQIEVALRFGDRDADYHAPCLQRMEVRNGTRGHLMQGHVQRGAHADVLAHPEFRQMLETAIEQFQRNAPAYQYRSHNLQNLQDYLDYYHILADAYAQKIQQTGATHALFYCVPHLGYDTILYQVACAMGLKIIVLCQTIFPSLYFSMARIDDLGTLDVSGSDSAPMLIEKGSAPALFYMDDRWQKPARRGQIGTKAVLSLMKHVALKKPGKMLDVKYVLGNLRRMRDIYGALPDWRDPFAKFFHVNELAYFEHLAEHESAVVDLNVRFIYVPLHNQPEMSTSALGGQWRDQLLMVEALARHLPDDWQIYVKENPRQGAYARGPMFWHRLSRIKGVRFMPSSASTHELSAHAQFVATVTGTAAWEAIRKGRPALVFGNAWYKSLPGIHLFHEGVDFAAIAASTFEHTALEKAAGALVARCHAGVIEPIYLSNASDFDAVRNLDQVARTTMGLLQGRVPLTYGSTLGT